MASLGQYLCVPRQFGFAVTAVHHKILASVLGAGGGNCILNDARLFIVHKSNIISFYCKYSRANAVNLTVVLKSFAFRFFHYAPVFYHAGILNGGAVKFKCSVVDEIPPE